MARHADPLSTIQVDHNPDGTIRRSRFGALEYSIEVLGMLRDKPMSGALGKRSDLAQLTEAEERAMYQAAYDEIPPAEFVKRVLATRADVTARRVGYHTGKARDLWRSSRDQCTPAVRDAREREARFQLKLARGIKGL